MSHPERRAALLLLALAVAGQGVRVWLSRPDSAPGDVQLVGGSTRSAASHRDSAVQSARPLRLDERIDVDRGSAREIERLPHVGPALARRIVADRAQHGPFGSLAGLDRVPGVGPGLLKAIGDHVSFSAGTNAGRSAGTLATDPPLSFGHVPGPIDLNTADSATLEGLPGLGPYMAGRILTWRRSHGRFTSVDDLVKVGGIGPATLARVRDRLQISQ